jgi:hypothetical protein
MSNNDAQVLAALDDCIGRYFEERRKRLNGFVDRHFSLQETFETQKKSILADLLLNPLNAAWSIPFFFIKQSTEAFDKIGFVHWAASFRKIPSGIPTQYQRQMTALVVDELLEWKGEKNALLEEFRKDPHLSKLLKDGQLHRDDVQANPEFVKEIDKFSAARAMVSDIAGTVATLLAGWMFFGDRSLGIFGMGERFAKGMARDRAASHFFLGKGAGSAFYNIFPPQPTGFQIFVGIAGVGLMLALFSFAASLLTDPVRKSLGLHHRKLHHLLDRLEEQLFIQLKRKVRS